LPLTPGQKIRAFGREGKSLIVPSGISLISGLGNGLPQKRHLFERGFLNLKSFLLFA